MIYKEGKKTTKNVLQKLVTRDADGYAQNLKIVTCALKNATLGTAVFF